MKVDQVLNCTLIIRSQVEYSAAAQCTVLRWILETPATGHRRGFSDVEALLTTLRADLLALQNQLIPPDQQNLKKLAETDITPDTPDPRCSRKMTYRWNDHQNDHQSNRHFGLVTA